MKNIVTMDGTVINKNNIKYILNIHYPIAIPNTGFRIPYLIASSL